MRSPRPPTPPPTPVPRSRVRRLLHALVDDSPPPHLHRRKHTDDPHREMRQVFHEHSGYLYFRNLG